MRVCIYIKRNIISGHRGRGKVDDQNRMDTFEIPNFR